MRIPVRLIAVEGPPPPGFDAEGAGAVEAAPGATLADILARLGLPADEPYATLVNGEPVAVDARSGHRLEPGDSLTVFPPIKGGAGGAKSPRRARVAARLTAVNGGRRFSA